MRASSIQVTYERTRQPQPYESEKGGVVLTLVSPEGEDLDLDAEIAAALGRAKAQVLGAIGLTPAQKPAPEQKVAPASEQKAAPAQEPKKAEPVKVEAKAMTDSELRSNVGAVMGKLKGTPNVAALIGDVVAKFAEGGVKDPVKVPAERRADFIAALKALVK